MKTRVAVVSLTAVLALAACNNTTTCADGQVLVNGVCTTPVTTGIASFVNPNGYTYVVKNSAGAVVTNYTTLAPGAYTVVWSKTGFVTSDPYAFTITAGNTTTVTAPTLAAVNPTVKTGAYYVGADGKKVYFSDDPTALRAAIAAGKFRFSSWLENEAGGVTIGTNGSITGAPTAGEQFEYAPYNSQNVMAAYMEYNDGGTWRPVVNSEVRMDILEQTGSVRFSAADDMNRDSIQALEINSNALSSRSWTNSASELDYVAFPSSANYPLYNVTGVNAPNVDGFTWATLNHDPKYVTTVTSETGEPIYGASARVRAIGYVNGNEIDKQFVEKRYIASAKVSIVKDLVVVDRATGKFVSVLTDNTEFLPGQEVGVRIMVTNSGQAPATTIKVSDVYDGGNSQTNAYSLGISPAQRAWAASQGITLSDKIDDNFDFTINSLAAGESKYMTFTATGVDNGQYCDTASLTSYVNNTGLLPAYYGTKSDKACFTVKGAPNVSIIKTLVDANGTPIADAMDVNRNQDVRIRITVRNGGTGTATDIKVTDRLNTNNAATHSITVPSGTTAAQDNDGFDWTIPSLPAGGVVFKDFVARASADGKYCDTATVTQGTFTASDDACFTVSQALLTLTKTNDPSTGLVRGSNYTSTMIVRNIGTRDATNVRVSDLLGQLYNAAGALVTPITQVTFQSGRYIITTDQLLPGMNVERGVALTGTAPSVSAYTIGDLVDTADQGVTIPAGGFLTFNVVSTIPANAAPGRYCDVATVTAASYVQFVNNRAEACVTVDAISAVQAQMIDGADPIAQGGTTPFYVTAYNEAQSTEALNTNVMTFNVGSTASDVTPTSAAGAFNISNIQVRYDNTVTLSSGTVIYDATAPLLNAGTDYTVSPVDPITGKFSITFNAARALNPNEAYFVTFNGGIPATLNPGKYYSVFEWTSKGVTSGSAQKDGDGESTNVKLP